MPILFFFSFLCFTMVYFSLTQGTIPSQSFVSIPASCLLTGLQPAAACSVLASDWCLGSLGVHRPVAWNAAALCSLLLLVSLVCGVVHVETGMQSCVGAVLWKLPYPGGSHWIFHPGLQCCRLAGLMKQILCIWR